mmetsp:Transcript_23876/g.64511  ORF Transcript_23876/g.64511 Transcript_23876/m.64511 type:complete len:165 (+) Transcript_23876:552-1046(+)
MCWLPRRNHQCYYQPSQSLLQWRAVYCATTQQPTIPPRHHQPRHSTNPVAMFWLMCLARGKDHGAPEPHVADGRHMSTRLRQFKPRSANKSGTRHRHRHSLIHDDGGLEMDGVGLDDTSDEMEDDGGVDEGSGGLGGRTRGEGGGGAGLRVIDSCSSPLVVDVL